LSEKNAIKSFTKLKDDVEYCFIGKSSHFLAIEDELKNLLPSDKVRFEYFDDAFFESTKTYNILLLSYDFYKRFQAFKYLLICQLDSFVIHKNINSFLDRNYIYCGAPFMGIHNDTKKLTIGNGGFSLRKVSFFENFSNRNTFLKSTFYWPLKIRSRWWRIVIQPIIVLLIRFYAFLIRKDPILEVGKIAQTNEDIIWSQVMKKYNCIIPSFEEALQFSFDKLPETCFIMNEEKLPFGCHGFNKKYANFWRKHLPDAF